MQNSIKQILEKVKNQVMTTNNDIGNVQAVERPQTAQPVPSGGSFKPKEENKENRGGLNSSLKTGKPAITPKAPTESPQIPKQVPNKLLNQTTGSMPGELKRG